MANEIKQVYSSPIEEALASIKARKKENEVDFNKSTLNFSSSINNISSEMIDKILDSLSKDYSNIKNLKPEDITFEDYQKLSYEVLEAIFDGDGEKIGSASSLMSKAQLTNDEVLNKIYFDEEKKAIQNNEPNKYEHTLGMIGIMYGQFSMDEKGAISIKNPYGTHSAPKDDLYTTKDELFSDFDKFKEFYNSPEMQWTGAINMNEVFKTMDDIKELYAKKVQENNSILNAYTRNTKEKVI